MDDPPYYPWARTGRELANEFPVQKMVGKNGLHSPPEWQNKHRTRIREPFRPDVASPTHHTGCDDLFSYQIKFARELADAASSAGWSGCTLRVLASIAPLS